MKVIKILNGNMFRLIFNRCSEDHDTFFSQKNIVEPNGIPQSNASFNVSL